MTGRTFLITGASKGIGRALSRRLADSGHHVVGVARGQDPDFPGTLVSIDLNDSMASSRAFADLARRYSFDGVVNNVGLARLHRAARSTLMMWTTCCASTCIRRSRPCRRSCPH